MPKFKDETGDEWTLVLNVGVARELKKKHDFDIGRLADKEAFAAFYAELGTDPVFLSDLLQVLCAAQVTGRQLTPDGFDRRLAGDALDGAAVALVECVINFISAKSRPTIRRLAKKSEQAVTEMNRQNLERLDAIDLQELCGEISGDSPESSTPGPTPTPTEN